MKQQMNADTILSIQNLSMAFGGIKALSDVSFDIKKGAVHSLIGPNGAGKTTVFNCCTGFYIPNEGDVFFNSEKGACEIIDLVGRPVEGKDLLRPDRIVWKFARKMFSGTHKVCQRGMVRTFQNVRLFKEMTAIENLLVAQHQDLNWNILSGVLNTGSYQKANQECIERAFSWLEILGLENDAQTLAGSLPYGKTRKLELARAMCTSPILVCLDEPAAGLNARETHELSEIVIKLRDEHKVTVFLIEHDMRMVMEISDRIVVLDHGEVIADGTPNNVQNNPKVIEAYLGVDDDE